MIYKRVRYIIGNDKGYFLVKRDKKITICDSEGLRDTFEIIMGKGNIIKIRYDFLPRYYLKEVKGKLLLDDSNNNEIFRYIKKKDNKFSFLSTTTNLALTVNKNNIVVLDKYRRNNKKQEFIIKRIDY